MKPIRKADNEKLPETLEIDGKNKSTINNEGNLISNTKDGIKNFYKWFGNSKIVDDKNRPIVVHHGTNYIFDNFDKSKTKKGKGFWFTDNSEYAQSHGNILKSLYLKANKVFDADNDEDIMKYTDDPENIINDPETQDKLIQDGYDAISFTTYDNGRTIIVFEPDQIKSVESNDSHKYANKDIRRSILKYTKIANNENFDIESPDNIWTVDMYVDSDGPDGHDNVEFTKIGLIDFLNGLIEEYDDPDYGRLSQNVSNKELREAVYNLLEGKVISIEPYHRIQGSSRKKILNPELKNYYNNDFFRRNSNMKFYKYSTDKRVPLTAKDCYYALKNDIITRSDGEIYRKTVEKAVEKSWNAYDLLADEKITKEDGELFKKAVEKAMEDSDTACWLLSHRIITRSDGEIFKEAVEKAIENPERAYSLLDSKEITKSDVSSELWEKILSSAERYNSDARKKFGSINFRRNNSMRFYKMAGWRVEKVNENDWIIHTPRGYYVDENDKEYHFSTKEKALAELDYLMAEHKYEKKAYYDEYGEYDSKSPEYIYSLLVNGNIAEYKKALNDMTKRELMHYLRWADEMDIDDSKLNLHYITASKQRIIRKAVRIPGKKYRIDINTVLDVFVGEVTDIVDYKVNNDKLWIKHDYGTKTVSLNDCEKTFGLVNGYWKYDGNGNIIGFGGTYQQEDMEEKEASCKKSAKRTMPLRLRRKIAVRRKAGESYGWVVDSADAYDALNKFVEEYGTEETLDAITRAMSNDDLADILAYIFRMYDFEEGCSDYKKDEEKE